MALDDFMRRTSNILDALSTAIEVGDNEVCLCCNQYCVHQSSDCFLVDAKTLIEALLREREALLSDLRGKCSVCKHYSGYHRRGKCKKCIHDPVMSPLDREYITQDHWEWHGAQK